MDSPIGSWRRSKGVSQAEAASVLNTAQSVVCIVERGYGEIPPVMAGMLMTLMTVEEYQQLEQEHAEFMDERRSDALAKMQGRTT
jgi:hypothetical protein